MIRARALVAALDDALVALDGAATTAPMLPRAADLPPEVSAQVEAAVAAARRDAYEFSRARLDAALAPSVALSARSGAPLLRVRV